MSDPGPFDDDDLPEGFDALFGGDPAAMLQNLMNLLGGLGSGGANAGAQMAMQIATGGASEPNVDPVDRMAIEQLARVAELRIADATGLRLSDANALTVEAVTRSEWVRRSMDAYRPVVERVAGGLTSPVVDESLSSDPQFAMLEQLMSSFRPMMVSTTTSSMIGHLGASTLSSYALPIPRGADDTLMIVIPAVDELVNDWSLDANDVRMWVTLNDVAHHGVLRVPHVRDRILHLLGAYADAFRNDPSAIEEMIGDVEPTSDPMALQQQLQSMFGDPTAMLGSMRSDEQRALLPEIHAAIAVVVGVVDHVMDQVGNGLIAGYAQITEALRRRRVTASASDRFVDRLLGLELDQPLYDRGRAFVDGVIERAGEDGLAALWSDAEHLPTANEIEAPGLWLARVGIDFELPLDALGEDPLGLDELGDSEEE